MSSPLHAGDQCVQSRAGVRDTAKQIGNHMIRAVMPEQHCEACAPLPALLVAAADGEGQPHESIFGNPVREPRCGLLFADSASGDLLQNQAPAELIWPEQYATSGMTPSPFQPGTGV